MDFAVCAAFLEEDVWENRLRHATSPLSVEITGFNSAQTLLPVLELKPFTLLVVTLNGAAGLNAVRQIRLKQPQTPLLWISDKDFSLLGYKYHVTCFLRSPVCDDKLREAVKNCLEITRALERHGGYCLPRFGNEPKRHEVVKST